MAYEVIARTPKGRPSRYVDTETEETLSARQYRNRTEAERGGYKTLSQKQKAVKKHTIVSKTGLVQHHYNLGLPSSLRQAVSDIIRQYEYQDSFAIGAHYIVYEEGVEEYKGSAQSSLRPCLPKYMQELIEELRISLSFYGTWKITGYFVTIYPKEGDL